MGSRPSNQRRHIPFVGNLTAAELTVLIGLGVAGVLGILGIMAFLPLLHGILEPGSGGGAQALVAFVLLPGVFALGIFALFAAVAFVLALYATVKKNRSETLRQTEHDAPPNPTVDPDAPKGGARGSP